MTFAFIDDGPKPLLDPRDLRIDTYSGGTGDFTMRLTHLPSGKSVSGAWSTSNIYALTRDALRDKLEWDLAEKLLERTG